MGIIEWILLIIALVMITSTPFFLVWLSGGDSFFTRVEERAAKAVMRGGADGDFARFVMSRSGQHLNVPGTRHYNRRIPAWEIIPHAATEDSKYENRSWLLRKLGVHWLGVPGLASIYTYKFQWSEPCLDRTTGKHIMRTRTEMTDIIVVSDFTYRFKLVEAETADNLPVDIEFDLVVRITNPFKALFEVEEWMKAVSAAVLRSARSHVGDTTFDDLRSETEGDADSFSRPILEFNFQHPDDAPLPSGQNPRNMQLVWAERRGLIGRYGVQIVSVNPGSVTLTGPNADAFQNTTVKLYTAQQDAAAVKAKADGDAHAITAVGSAEAGVIKSKGLAEGQAIAARMKAWSDGGDLAPIIAQTEAIAKAADGAGNTIVWAGNPFTDPSAAKRVIDAVSGDKK